MKLKNYLENSWFPIAGWALALGFIANCVIAPYLAIASVNWVLLVTLLVMLLGWKGAEDCKTENCECHQNEYPRHWIVVIGWSICVGLANNAIVAQFVTINTIDWIEILSALAALIALGTTREMRLNKVDSHYTKKQLWIAFSGIVLAVSILVICALAPYTELISSGWTLNEVDWYYIVAGLGVVGGNEGVRKMFLAKAENRAKAVAAKVQKDVEASEETEKEE